MKNKITILVLLWTLLGSAAKGMQEFSKSLPNLHELEENVARTQELAAKIKEQTSMQAAADNLNAYINTRQMSNGPSPNGLLAAVASGLVHFVDAYLTQDGVEIDANDARGNTALHVALITYENRDASMQIVAALLARGANVNALNGEGYSPLVEAILSEAHVDLLQMLLEGGASASYHIWVNGHTPLQVAVVAGHYGAMEMLLNNWVFGNQIDARNSGGQTALHLAGMWGHPYLGSMLRDRGADTNAVDDGGNTPLHYGNSLFSWVLLKSNRPTLPTNINTRNEYGFTALYLATYQQREPKVYELTKYNCVFRWFRDDVEDLYVDLDARDYLGRTALHISVLAENEEITRRLLLAGSRTDIMDHEGNTPLHLASTCANIVRRLLETRRNPPHIDARNFKGATVLHMAAEKGIQLPLVLELLGTHGAQMNIADFEGNTVLHTAARFSTIEVVYNTLVGYNINGVLNSHNNQGATPLQVAMDNDAVSVDFFNLLLQRGANILTEDNDGDTLLHTAARISDSMMRLLLSNGLTEYVNKTGRMGQTPLHRAALRTSLVAVGLLLENGANPNIQDDNGDTPFYAMLRHVVLPLNGDAHTVYMVLAAVTNQEKTNLSGDTAYDVFLKATSPKSQSITAANVEDIRIPPRRKSI